MPGLGGAVPRAYITLQVEPRPIIIFFSFETNYHLPKTARRPTDPSTACDLVYIKPRLESQVSQTIFTSKVQN